MNNSMKPADRGLTLYLRTDAFVIVKRSRKDSVDRGVQFITPAGLKQSFLFSQGTLTNFSENLIYLKCMCSNPHPQIP